MPLKEQEEPENENCLRGIRCPKCKQQDRFRIVGTCTFDVTDDGSEAVGDHDWDGESYISCPECGHEGKVEDFCMWRQVSSMA